MYILSPGSRHAKGMTLVELLTVLAMVSIVLSIGVPSISSLLDRSRITSTINNMVRHLHYARSEAVTSGLPVILCPSTTGVSCENSFHWEHGFIVFIDRDRDREPSNGEEVLRHTHPSSAGTMIFTSPGRKKITYQASGMAAGSTATFTVCNSSGKARPKAIIVSNPGRPRLADTRADGSPLNCI